MHTLLLDGLLLAIFALILLHRKGAQEWVKDFLTVGEDRWTWTTRNGDCYEDVELEHIEGGEVVIRHKFGTDRLAIDRLSDSSRDLLFRTSLWRDHVAAGPTAGKISPFIDTTRAQAA